MIVDIVPLVALVLGVLWAMWAARPKREQGVRESVEDYQRVLHALEPGRPVRERPRTVGHSH